MTYNRSTVYLKRPASNEHEMWKDSLPIGDGITGALIRGAISEETIILTRHDLWGGKKPGGIPDLSDSLREMRRRIDNGDFFGANDVLYEKLRMTNQDVGTAPFPLGEMTIDMESPDGILFRHYRRGIDMERGTAFVEWEDRSGKHSRNMFISKHDGIFYCEISDDSEATYHLGFGLHDSEHSPAKNIHLTVSDSQILFSAEAWGGGFGAAICIRAEAGSEVKESAPGKLMIRARSFTIMLKTFTVRGNPESESRIDPDISAALSSAMCALKAAPDFKTALKSHSRIFVEKFNRVSICLAPDDDEALRLSNRELLDIAYEDTAPAALFEKLWRFARYLFISGTADGGEPFSLYGIWFAEHCLCWASNVCNENIEMIYWHTLSGGLADSVKELILYYCCKIPEFQRLAKQVYGCRGIFIPAYTHPMTLDGRNDVEFSPCVPVISSWISSAGWLAIHFYQYYQYTHDCEMLNAYILPFMIETARFYADYVIFDKNGRIRIYPSVSPENTPGNLMNPEFAVRKFDHNCPSVENSTMDFAVMKSLFTNLFLLLQEKDCEVSVSEDELSVWHHILDSIPAYMVNKDGAVKEWMSERLDDYYPHRHFSHIFPLFPGREINPGSDANILAAFRRAVELRPHGSQSGWSFSHVAEIWARLGKADMVLENMNFFVKGCILDNFLSLHNDWRHMGASVVWNIAPVQLDALMGYASVIQDMIMQYDENDRNIRILPAFPSGFKYLRASGLCIPGGKVSVELQDKDITVSTDLCDGNDLTVVYGNTAIKVSGGKSVIHYFR